MIPRAAIRQKELDTLVTAGKKEMAANPQKILKFELRPLGTAQVLERQRVGDPAPLTTYDKNNQPHETTESYFEWTMDVFVPHEDAFQDHQLSFLALTKAQYEKDKDFLHGIMSTLAYVNPNEPKPGSSSTMPAATQPAISATPVTPAPPAPAAKP
jgi:hypothetical protein